MPINLISIETSSKPLSVALFQDGILKEEIWSLADEKTHSEQLLPFIDEILKRRNLTPQDIARAAVATGPGSFTCLRVGLSTVLGFALSAGWKVIPVSSLKALAFGAKVNGVCSPVFKAGRERMYAGLYQNGKEIVSDQLTTPSDWILQCEKKGHVTFVGPGIEMLPENYSKLELQPRASFVGQLALFEKLEPVPVSELNIRYLQEPDLGGK